MKSFSLGASVAWLLLTFSHGENPTVHAPVKIEVAVKELAEGAQLLDVRTRDEWNQGHLKDAILVTVTEDGFLEKAKAVLNQGKPVVVYCRSGKRSAMAAGQLRAAGFTVHDLEGGITAWIAAGKEVVKPDLKPDHAEAAVPTAADTKKLNEEIEQGRRNIRDIEAFVQMERAKLEENPDYDPSFLEEALGERQGILEKVEEAEARLKEIGR